MTKQPEPYRYIHAAGPLSTRTTFQLILTGSAPRPTAKELEALVTLLKLDIEILRAGTRPPNPTAELCSEGKIG